MESALKRFYAEEIRAAAALPNTRETDRVLEAFAAVPREKHVGPGPWLLRSPLFGLASRRTPDSNPEHLYHNVLIALDEERGINVGEPSLWARFFGKASIAEGSRVLQIGSGSGYFTAVLAELVGPTGSVVGTEVNPALAEIAASALSDRPNVAVRCQNGATELADDEGPFDLIVAFAGVTHPAAKWRKSLSANGRMLLPLTGDSWWGAMVLFEFRDSAVRGVTLGKCGFYPCEGARNDRMAKELEQLWSKPRLLNDAQLEFCENGSPMTYRLIGSVDTAKN